MSYDSNVIQAASRQLEEQRSLRANNFALRRSTIYTRIPRTREIDRLLQASVPAVLSAAMKKGEDPAAAVRKLEEENISLQRERGELLKANGFDEHALEDLPACSLCNDTGWRGSHMCSCLKALCAKEQIRCLSSLLDLNGQSFASFRLDLYSDEPISGKQFSPRENMQNVYGICRLYAERFPNFPRKNLLLSGSPGLGKTFLSASIAGVVAQRGYSVVYDTAVNIFRQFEARKFEGDAAAQVSVNRYLQCDLLILDDLGSEMVTAFTESVLYEVINSRLISGKHTVISTNLELGTTLSTKYSPMIYSRIAGEYAGLSFYGADIRQMKRNQV